MTLFKERLIDYLPSWLLGFCAYVVHPLKYYRLSKESFFLSQDYLEKQRLLHNKAIEKLKCKNTWNCVFFAIYESVWKYDALYRLMERNERFNPTVLVCPAVNRGRKHMLESLHHCYDSFKKRGYNVLLSYNDEKGTYVDVRKELNPDIIFYTNPYKGLIDDRYYIYQFRDLLTVYVTYGFGNTKDFSFNFNQPLHNLVWRNYVETNKHLDYARLGGNNNGRNTVVTGYLGIENLIDTQYKVKNNYWKFHDNQRKKIIWAPHHTLEPVGPIHFSCFLDYCDFMVDLAKKYAEKIQIAFKPHPLLRPKLEQLWGEEKTNSYYETWANMSNTSLVEGDYIDLFLTSDAMLHDCGSFLIEYLYVNKPVMRTSNGIPLEDLFNDFTLEALKYYYHAFKTKDVERFICDVINGIDLLKEQRTAYVNEVLMPKGGLPSENILNDIINSIDHNENT
ncbi:MAG: CDP-glycerol glycerophosphotransferase family protein [Prevotella sp.]|nr:CDP-glycerol glycerophosphotransferase family protein [Prevotella sp.]